MNLKLQVEINDATLSEVVAILELLREHSIPTPETWAKEAPARGAKP